MQAIITAITDVFSAVSTWLLEAIGNIAPIFYTAEGGLTLIGVTTMMGLGISIIFLLIGVVSNFLHFGR